MISIEMNLFRTTYLLFRKAYLPVVALALLSSCSESEPPYASDSAQLEMRLGVQSLTKSHFTDEDGTARFVWDVGSSMIAAVSNGAELARWTDGSYFSPMHISLVDPTGSDRVLGAGSALTLPSNAAQAVKF